MKNYRCVRAMLVAVTVTLIIAISPPTHAAEPFLITIGPRIGFSTTTPLLGKQQKVDFHLYDIAAFWRLPWQFSSRHGSWDLGTRLLTSVGVIEGAGTAGLFSTVVPDVALSGWNGFATLDAGVGAGLFSTHQFGVQDFGGPAQIVATIGIAVTPITHGYAGFRLQHFSDAGLYGSDAMGVDMYLLELGYKF